MEKCSQSGSWELTIILAKVEQNSHGLLIGMPKFYIPQETLWKRVRAKVK